MARGPVLLLAFVLGVGCASAPPPGTADSESTLPTWDGEDLEKQLARDLAVAQRREAWRDAAREVDEALSADRRAVRLDRHDLRDLVIPVDGVGPRDLEDNFGAPRDGGTRSHKGIDIFAPRGTRAVAVADAVITYVGEQRLGGKCVWIRSLEGAMFYYAHLDRWAPGIHEGMKVKRGETLGFVGTSGNAANTPPHLHFQVVSRSETLNPYPVLLKATTGFSRPVLTGGFGRVAASN